MVFLDTNVLVYYTTPRSPHHAAAVEAMAGELVGAGAALSRQVLREYLAVMSRTQVHHGPQPPEILVDAVRAFETRFHVLEDCPAVTVELLALMQRVQVGGKQIHDANLVATMLVHGVTTLLTANVQDFQRFTPEIQLLPWPATPAE